jgi:hypothetical protein
MTDLERIAGSGKIAYFRNTGDQPHGYRQRTSTASRPRPSDGFTATLRKKGYSEADVRKTFGNTLREVNGK